jgi:hypothetical protein
MPFLGFFVDSLVIFAGRGITWWGGALRGKRELEVGPPRALFASALMK